MTINFRSLFVLIPNDAFCWQLASFTWQEVNGAAVSQKETLS
jgi:hypothetical protein